MGFCTRIINSKRLKLTYSQEGIEGVKILYKADAYILDKIASKILILLLENNILEIDKRLKS